jgi:hypothetical protein
MCIANFLKSSLLFFGALFFYVVVYSAEPATPSVTNSLLAEKPAVTSADVTNAAPTAAAPESAPGSKPVILPQNNNPEKMKMLFATRFLNFDLRKLSSIKFPPLDLLKDQEEKYKDVHFIKDPQLFKQRIKEACLDYVVAYEESIRKELGSKVNFGTQFSINCDIYAELLKSEPMDDGNTAFEIPNEGLLRRLDQVAYSQFIMKTNDGLKRLQAVENLIKAHETSLFGLAGIPISFSFLLTQVILVIVLAISLFLLYKKLTE